ncbi:MAG TPA: S-methyl-5'-thioinosine phosphorylase [Spongiibacteraceae bacterium]|nr:S-methyl-5'-thioinosine phosphorylase [Spongiibacteraceae bacterium]
MTNKVAIIGGTGVDKFASWEFVDKRARGTDYGAPSSAIETYRCMGEEFHFLARHGRPHHIAPHCINYRANLRILHDLGVGRIIAINSVGGIAVDAAAGAVIIPDQIIDYTYGREHTFFAGDTAPVQHVEFTEPYSQLLRMGLLQAATSAGVKVMDGGVYGAVQGPRLETAAEIRRMERDGCTIVGMTGMPEAVLARELAMDYAALCVVVNAAAGKSAEPLTIEAMQAAMSSALADIEKILLAFFARR